MVSGFAYVILEALPVSPHREESLLYLIIFVDRLAKRNCCNVGRVRLYLSGKLPFLGLISLDLSLN